jgi:hypothetical protein
MEDLKTRLCTLAEVGVPATELYGDNHVNCTPYRVTWHSICTTSLSDDRTNPQKNMGFGRTMR